MSVERRGGMSAPWLLPVVLALLVAAVVLFFVFRSRISSSSSSPTATATPLVVTATPASGQTVTPGSGTAIPATATPAGSQGKSTPVPHATPVPTVVGLQLGMVSRNQKEVNDIQAAVDRKDPKYTYYLDPRQVVQNTLPHYGFTQSLQIVEPNPNPTPTPHTGPGDTRPIIDFVINYQNKEYTVVVAQPAKRGAAGIWLIITIVPGKQTI